MCMLSSSRLVWLQPSSRSRWQASTMSRRLAGSVSVERVCQVPSRSSSSSPRQPHASRLMSCSAIREQARKLKAAQPAHLRDPFGSLAGQVDAARKVENKYVIAPHCETAQVRICQLRGKRQQSKSAGARPCCDAFNFSFLRRERRMRTTVPVVCGAGSGVWREEFTCEFDCDIKGGSPFFPPIPRRVVLRRSDLICLRESEFVVALNFEMLEISKAGGGGMLRLLESFWLVLKEGDKGERRELGAITGFSGRDEPTVATAHSIVSNSQSDGPSMCKAGPSRQLARSVSSATPSSVSRVQRKFNWSNLGCVASVCTMASVSSRAKIQLNSLSFGARAQRESNPVSVIAQ
eukprot:CAMPEP_0179965206 /NCGR_PEP_ID=MMETSP0983-20121128/31752_1 /TAXON_ID=483367 /ORGANISM="non described non described, Strain CCMP 2436" /LENGTH=348 /DNA_ID=CAMNT_0021878011 /DNA_START=292 /DNA_END=1338 /DNA_ORIENTATION=-